MDEDTEINVGVETDEPQLVSEAMRAGTKWGQGFRKAADKELKKVEDRIEELQQRTRESWTPAPTGASSRPSAAERMRARRAPAAPAAMPPIGARAWAAGAERDLAESIRLLAGTLGGFNAPRTSGGARKSPAPIQHAQKAVEAHEERIRGTAQELAKLATTTTAEASAAIRESAKETKRRTVDLRTRAARAAIQARESTRPAQAHVPGAINAAPAARSSTQAGKSAAEILEKAALRMQEAVESLERAAKRLETATPPPPPPPGTAATAPPAGGPKRRRVNSWTGRLPRIARPAEHLDAIGGSLEKTLRDQMGRFLSPATGTNRAGGVAPSLTNAALSAPAAASAKAHAGAAQAAKAHAGATQQVSRAHQSASANIKTHASRVRDLAFSQRIFNQAGAVFIGLSLHRTWSNVLGAIAGSKAEWLELERIMQSMASISDQLAGDALPRMKEAIKSTSVQAGRSPIEIASATYEALQTNIHDTATALRLAELASRGATLGLSNTDTVIKALLAVMNAYGYANIEAATQQEYFQTVTERGELVLDKLFVLVRNGAIKWEQLGDAMGNVITTAASLGFSLDDVLAAIATLTKQGLSPAKATTALNNLLTHLVHSSGEAENAAAALGVEMSGLSVGQNGLRGKLLQVNVAVSQQAQAIEAALASGASYASVIDMVAQRTALTSDLLVAMFPDLRTLRGAAGLTGQAFQMFAGDLRDVIGAQESLSLAWERYTKSDPYRADKIRQSFNRLAMSLWNNVYPAFLSLGALVDRTGTSFLYGFAAAVLMPVKALGLLSDSVHYLLDLLGEEWMGTFGAAAQVAGVLAGSIASLTAAVVGFKLAKDWLLLSSVLEDGTQGASRLTRGKAFLKASYVEAGAGAMRMLRGPRDAIPAAYGAYGMELATGGLVGLGKRAGRGIRRIDAAGVGLLQQGAQRISRGATRLAANAYGAAMDPLGALASGTARAAGGAKSIAQGAGRFALAGFDAYNSGVDSAIKKTLSLDLSLKGALGSIRGMGAGLLRAGASFGVWGIGIAAAIGLVIALGITVARNTKGIKESFSRAWERGIKPVLMALGKFFFSVINRILEYLSIFTNAWLGVIAIFSDSNKTWSEKLTGLGKLFITTVIEIAKFWISRFADLIDVVQLILVNGRTAIQRILLALVDIFIDVGVSIWQNLSELFSGGIGGLRAKLMAFVDMMGDIGNNIMVALKNGVVWALKRMGGVGEWIGQNVLGIDMGQVREEARANVKTIIDEYKALPPALAQFMSKHHGDPAVLDKIGRTQNRLSLLKLNEQDISRALQPISDAERTQQLANLEDYKKRMNANLAARNAVQYKTSWQETVKTYTDPQAQAKIAQYVQEIAANQSLKKSLVGQAMDAAEKKEIEDYFNAKLAQLQADLAHWRQFEVSQTVTKEREDPLLKAKWDEYNSHYLRYRSLVDALEGTSDTARADEARAELERVRKEIAALQAELLALKASPGGQDWVSAFKSMGISVDDAFDPTKLDEWQAKLLNAKLAVRQAFGVEDLSFVSLEQLRKNKDAIGSNLIQPILDAIDLLQKEWGLNFEDLGKTFGFDPVKLTLGTFEDFISALKDNTDAIADGQDSAEDWQKILDQMRDSQQQMNDVLAGKRLDQNVVVSPYIEIKVDGELTEEQRQKIAQTVQDAIAEDLKRGTLSRLYGRF